MQYQCGRNASPYGVVGFEAGCDQQSDMSASIGRSWCCHQYQWCYHTCINGCTFVFVGIVCCML